MTSPLHDVLTRTVRRETRSIVLVPRSDELNGPAVDVQAGTGLQARATRLFVVGSAMFVVSMAVGALLMSWATTYQGHRSMFTPWSITLVVGVVAGLGALELASSLLRHPRGPSEEHAPPSISQ